MRQADIEDLYELSPLQQGILFHCLATPDDGLYLITMSYALKGRLDRSAFARAWQQTVDRNPILRTSFHWEDINKPLQIVHRDVRLPLEELDWRGIASQEQEERLAAFLERERTRSFPLDRAPLLRLTLIRTSDERHRLIWTFHHVLLEGWSASLVLQEVFSFYRGLRKGEDMELPRRRPYRDYILSLQERDLSRAEAYWRRTLEGFSSPTPLPVARPSAPSGPVPYGKQLLALPASTSTALTALARRHRLTLNTVLQGTWAVLLSRYSGEEDVLFGSVVSGRQEGLPEAESMVGLFVNTLPARVLVRPQAPVLVWLEEVQNRQAEMREFEYSPLLQVQGWSAVPSGTRLFETLFAFQNWMGDVSLRDWAEELEVEEGAVVEGGTDYPLVVEAGSAAQISAVFTYDRRRFADDAITRLMGHYGNLLDGIITRPEARICELPLIAAEERRQLSDWTATATEYPREKTIADLFEGQAKRTPEAVAVVFGAKSLSYRDLDSRANQLAHHLRKLGVGPEVLVGIAMERSLELVVGLVGILKAGGAYVPLDPSYPGERLAFMVKDSQVGVLLTQERLLDRLPARGPRVVCLDRDWAEISRGRGEGFESGATAENLAYVTYTSGSTGPPKGVEVRQQGVLRLLFGAEYAEFGPGETFLQLAPVSFDASTLELWGALLHGGKCVLYPERVPAARELGEVLARERVTTLWLTASLFNAVLDEFPEALRGVKQLLIGGEALSVRHVRRGLEALPGTRIINGYGPTEGTTFTCCYAIPRKLPEQVVSIPIGRPISNTRVYVVDEGMRPVPIGVGGELFLGGDGLARGYLGRPDLTAEKFVPDPFGREAGGRLYRTGDLVRWLPDGNLEFLGRKDHQVKVRGFRIELGEIESVLGRYPGVKDAVVMAREDHPGDKRLVAYVVGEAGASELRTYLQGKVPAYMVPSAFVFLESLPLTPNGKVDRRALPTPDGRPHPDQALVPPRNDLEKKIAGIWQDVLHLDEVTVHDNFFDLGGHSLALLRVHGRLREGVTNDVNIVDLFQYPTVAALAAHLSAAPGPTPARAEDEEAETVRTGRERLGRRRGIRETFVGTEDADA